jgi:hypothetical protein
MLQLSTDLPSKVFPLWKSSHHMLQLCFLPIAYLDTNLWQLQHMCNNIFSDDNLLLSLYMFRIHHPQICWWNHKWESSNLSPTHSHQFLNSNLSSPLISFIEIQHWSFSISFDPKDAIAIYFSFSCTTGVFFPGFIYPIICPFFEV